MGNVIAPQELIQKYGADIIRLWVSVTDYREDVRLSQDILDRVIDTYRKIRNTLRFHPGKSGGFRPRPTRRSSRKNGGVGPGGPLRLEQAGGTSHHAISTRKNSTRSRPPWRTISASTPCRNITWTSAKMSSIAILPTLPRRRSTQTALWHMGRTLARALAPLLSFHRGRILADLGRTRPSGKGENPKACFSTLSRQKSPCPLGKYFVMATFSAPNGRQRSRGKSPSSGDGQIAQRRRHSNQDPRGERPAKRTAPEELASFWAWPMLTWN
jgi:hypothetical protein